MVNLRVGHTLGWCQGVFVTPVNFGRVWLSGLVSNSVSQNFCSLKWIFRAVASSWYVWNYCMKCEMQLLRTLFWEQKPMIAKRRFEHRSRCSQSSIEQTNRCSSTTSHSSHSSLPARSALSTIAAACASPASLLHAVVSVLSACTVMVSGSWSKFSKFSLVFLLKLFTRVENNFFFSPIPLWNWMVVLCFYFTPTAPVW